MKIREGSPQTTRLKVQEKKNIDKSPIYDKDILEEIKNCVSLLKKLRHGVFIKEIDYAILSSSVHVIISKTRAAIELQAPSLIESINKMYNPNFLLG